MIEILYNFNFRKIFISLVKSFNETYLSNINLKKFLRNKDTEEFFINLKYSSIIITSFIFLSKDINLYNNHFKKIREIYEQFLNACLDSTNKDILFSYKVFSFMNRYHKNKKNKLNCVNQIIKILFKNKLSYKNISNCLEQLMSNINIESTEDILTKINSTILYYYNSDAQDNEIKYNNDIVINKNITRRSSAGKSYYPSISLKNESSFNSIKLLNKNIYFYKGYNSFSKRNKTKNKISTIHQTEKKINNDFSDSPKPPFIKEEMPKNKKFCLILDIDETLTHFVKLPFGNYFLIRPGVLDLLKELCNYYEIDIFTAALQHYADNILDKLDKNNIYFSHRLYRCHCNWEEGKSIKKLKLIGRDLNKIVFIDDIKRNAKYNMKNLILIKKWSDDIYDQELISIKNKLKYIAECGKYDDDITVGIAEENLNALSYSNNNDE
jgi:CTD small phosphatase-like protein 2